MIRKFLFELFLLSAICTQAQKQEFVGVSLNGEMKNAENMRDGFGFFYENQLSTHHGFEVGLNQRFQDVYFTQEISNGTFPTFHIREDYWSLPVMYKFYSTIVNFSTGITLDYFVGWKDVSKYGEVETTSFNVNPKLDFGWVFKVSKTIQLSPKFALEPEIQFNPIFKYDYSFCGASMRLKYKL